jgi:GDP-L-fucose synthase
MHDLPELTVWGTGSPRREFLYARDLADACLFAMRHHPGPEPINLGGGVDLSITQVAVAVAEVVGYRGRICFDASKPDGAPFKGLDSTPLRALGWRPATEFRAALRETYAWFLRHAVREDAKDARATV